MPSRPWSSKPAHPPVAPSTPPPAAKAPEAPSADQHPEGQPELEPAASWGERFGTVGVVLLAVLAGVVAYSLSYLIKF